MAVKQVFTGDISQLEGAYRALMRQQEQLDAKMQKMAENSVKGSKTTWAGINSVNSAVSFGIDQVQSYAQSWVSLASIIAGVKQEAEELREVQNAAANELRGVGQSQSNLLFNLTGLPKDTIDGIFKSLDAIQKETKIGDIRHLNDAFANAMASTSGDVDVSLAITKAAAKLGRNSPENLTAIAGGAATIMEITGLSPEESLAFQTTIGMPSYIRDPAKQAEHIPSTIKSVIQTYDPDKVDTQEERRHAATEIGALFAAMGAMAGDKEGRSTEQELKDFSIQLRDYFKKGFEYTVSGRSFKRRPKEDPGTVEGRIQYLQEHDRDRKIFMEKMTGETKFRIAREGVLESGTSAQQVQEFKPMIKSDVGIYNESVDLQARGTKELREATRQAGITGNEQKRNRDELAAIQADARRIRDESLKQTRRYGGPYYGTKFLTDYTAGVMQDVVGEDRIEMAIADLERRRADIKQPGSLLGGRDRLAFAKSDEQLTPQESKDFKYLGEQLELLKELQHQHNELLRAQLEESKRQTGIIDRQERPGADPAAARAEIGGHREK